MSDEEATIRAFIQKNRQERFIQFLSNPGHRRKVTLKLAHNKWLDERFAHPIPASTAHTVKEIAALLRSKGAGAMVHVISEDRKIDGIELELETALGHIWGRGLGTILSCVPGHLAYFEDEEGSRLLER